MREISYWRLDKWLKVSARPLFDNNSMYIITKTSWTHQLSHVPKATEKPLDLAFAPNRPDWNGRDETIHAGHHSETGKQFTYRWLPGKDVRSLFILALIEEFGIDKFDIKHNRLPRNFFRPLNSGDTQFVCPRSRELINNSLFNDDLLCILALAEQEIAGFLIIACHHETAYDLHCCMQQDYNR